MKQLTLDEVETLLEDYLYKLEFRRQVDTDILRSGL